MKDNIPTGGTVTGSKAKEHIFMDDSLRELGGHITDSLGEKVLHCDVCYGELTVEVACVNLPGTLRFLRDNSQCRFTQLVDICGADYVEREKRFEVVYHLLSMNWNRRIRVKARTNATSLVPSVVDIFASANWYEREAFDLYGILFANHPDLRRILTDYGFSGHPLRKDFPLTGHVETRYDDASQKVIYEPVKLPQAYRSFDFTSPWEGMVREQDSSSVTAKPFKKNKR